MSKELAENGRGVSLSITNRDRHQRGIRQSVDGRMARYISHVRCAL